MKLLKLRASFGKLHGELNLQEGFQCLCLPNESGKSTWSAFLVAMLYGIDTSERANSTNQGLPMKERYKPWDGRAMEGSIELLWQGRHITIERSTTGKIPMGNFRAYETASGIPVTELTGENCGRVLCGVERGVFERTAFIRQSGLAVTEDAALEKRLGALVSTGEDGAKTYLELEEALRKRKNKLTGRVGRVPQLTAEKEQLQRSLRELYALREEAMVLTARKEAAQEENEKYTALLERIEKAKKAQKRAGVLALEEKMEAQEQLCARLESTAADLPGEEILHELQRKLEAGENALQTAKMDAAFGISEVAKPPAPQGFGEMSAEAAKEQARQDGEAFRRLSSKKPKKWILPLILSALLLVAGVFLQPYVGSVLAIVGLAALLLSFVLMGWSKAKTKEAAHQAQLIALRYGLTDCEKLEEIAQNYALSLEQYALLQAEAQAQKEALSAAVSQAEENLDSIAREIRSFAPNCDSISSCKMALSAALRSREQILTQRRALEALRQQHEALLLVLGSGEPEETDEEALALDETKISYEQRNAAQRFSLFSTELAQKQGAISAKGDSVALEAELEQVAEQLSAAREQSEGIDLALSALKAADETLRSRFSPQITREAGKLLAALTGDKYPTLLLEPDLRLSVREEGGTVMRPAAAMSCGTADQMYLALRLAMCHQLLSEEVPLILDDALVNFDEERAEKAISLLKKEAEKRQVILFTCRNFETGE